MRISDAVVLVVGSSGGIGSTCASAMSRRGARVIVHGRDPVRLDAAATEAGAKSIAADLTAPGAAETLAAEARDIYGRVDVVVHCIGAGWYGPAYSMSPDDIERMVTVNLTAPLRVTRALLDDMRSRGSGHVSFLASIAGWLGVQNEAVYSAAKAGVIAYAESLRLELSSTGVGVSVVSPAVVRTPFFERRGMAYNRRFPRPVPPERVAQAVVHAVEHDVAHQMIPRWLAVAPAVRATMPGPYRALTMRFGGQRNSQGHEQ